MSEQNPTIQNLHGYLENEFLAAIAANSKAFLNKRNLSDLELLFGGDR